MTDLVALPNRETVLSEEPAYSRLAMARDFLLAYGRNTRAAYERDLRRWFDFCETMEVEPMRTRRVHADAYARWLQETVRLAPASQARALAAASSFYAYAQAEHAVDENPFRRVRRPRRPDVVRLALDLDSLKALLSRAEHDGSRSHLLVGLLALNGLRVSEACAIDIEDITAERGHTLLRITRKGGRQVRVPLAPSLRAVLSAECGGRSAGPLLTTSTGARFDRIAAWRTVRRLGAGIDDSLHDLRPHDLRAAFVTLSLDAGASLRDVQDAVGHADPRTTRTYDRARARVERNPAFLLDRLAGPPTLRDEAPAEPARPHA